MGVFLTFVRPLTQFELMIYYFKLFTEFAVEGRMWLAIKDLYTGVKAQVLYSGSLSRSSNESQGTRQGRILAPFMSKDINSLLHVLSIHNYTICIRSLQLTSPSFADDIILLALHPSLDSVFMDMCHQYSIRWRYGFINHTKCGVVTIGESKVLHFQSMNERVWKLGNDIVDGVYDYKNLGVLKNYVGSFSSNVADNIEKTRKNAGMIFSSKFDRRKTNPLVYIKFWKQACLPSLLFGMLTPSLLLKLERCQLWFLKNIFYVPSFSHSALILKLSSLNSIEPKSMPSDYYFWVA